MITECQQFTRWFLFFHLAAHMNLKANWSKELLRTTEDVSVSETAFIASRGKAYLGWFVLFQKRAIHYWISYFWGKLGNQHTFWIMGSPPLGSVWFSVSCGTAVLNATEVVNSVQVTEHKVTEHGFTENGTANPRRSFYLWLFCMKVTPWWQKREQVFPDSLHKGWKRAQI